MTLCAIPNANSMAWTGHATPKPLGLGLAGREQEAPLDDQRLRNGLCWGVFDC
jgi:hypothetical protein